MGLLLLLLLLPQNKGVLEALEALEALDALEVKRAALAVLEWKWLAAAAAARRFTNVLITSHSAHCAVIGLPARPTELWHILCYTVQCMA